MAPGEEDAHSGTPTDHRTIAITGANGFIGRALTACALAHRIKVINLVRRPVLEGRDLLWTLGDPLPDSAAHAGAVFHLASATLIERTSLNEAMRRDVEGSRTLRDSVRLLRDKGRCIRLVFVSSQSAQPEAANAYGQSKCQIESELDGDDEIVVRPGLVYGDEAGSVVAMFEKLVQLPVVPVIRTAPNIQPIHVEELACCLLRIAALNRPQRLFELGAIEPMTFSQTVVATARRLGTRPPATIALPSDFIRLGAIIVDRILRLSPSLTERVDGLTSLRPMATAASLATLGYRLAPYNIAPASGTSKSSASRHTDSAES